MDINFLLGKNGGHTPNSLGNSLIAVIRQLGNQADEIRTCSLQNF